MGKSKPTKQKNKNKKANPHATPTTHLFRKDLGRFHQFKSKQEQALKKSLTNEECMAIILDKVS